MKDERPALKTRHSSLVAVLRLACGVAAFAILILVALSGLMGYGRARLSASKTNSELSQAAAGALEGKIHLLSDSAPGKATSFQPIVVSQSEANSYLKYHGQEFLPAGVNDPEIHITPERVSGVADVDFNKLNQGAKSDDWGTKMLGSVFQGRRRVSATGKLETGSGQGKVTIQNVVVGNVVIPDALVNLLIESYVQKRYKVDLSKAFALPDHVTRIELGSGNATFYRTAKKQ